MSDAELARRVAELEQQVAEARRATQASEALLRRVSHDLRTPLNNVFGALEIAEVQSDRPEAVVRWVAVARAASVRLRLMLDDLIAHARHTVGPPGELSFQEVHVAAAVAGAANEVRGLALARDRVIDASVEPADLTVTADPDALRHVLVDLLVNALARSADGPVTVRATVGAGGVEFAVADRSAGLTEAEQAALAMAYRPADPTPSVGPDLALTVARTLVSALGGELQVAASPGDGCTARFELSPGKRAWSQTLV